MSHIKHYVSSLERRFLDRVAQTTKVKTPTTGPSGGATGSHGLANAAPTHNTLSSSMQTGATIGKQTFAEVNNDALLRPSTPPWLRPPSSYKSANGPAFAAMDHSSSSTQSRAGGFATTENTNLASPVNGLVTDLTRRSHQNSMGIFQATQLPTNSVMHGFAHRTDSIGDELSQTILSQLLAPNNSNAQLNYGGTLPRDNSMVDAILKTAMSHEHITQLVRDGTLHSSSSLTNILQRQSSLDALLSLDLQSMNSMDNLSSLAQYTNTGSSQTTKSGLKQSLGIDGANSHLTSNNLSFGNISSLVNARRLASGGHLEHLMSSLGGNKVNSGLNSMNFPSFLQNVPSHPSSTFNNSNNSLLAAGKGILFGRLICWKISRIYGLTLNLF